MVRNLNFQEFTNEAITPLDGRNKSKLQSLSAFFSEPALQRYRLRIEVAYLVKLSGYGIIRKLHSTEILLLNGICDKFGNAEYKQIREIEKSTNHDVKAVEEYIKIRLKKTSLKDICEMIHFGLTSDDINNCAYALIIQDVLNKVIIPELHKILINLQNGALKYKSIPMLARTHGQPAAPTTVGKEYLVYYKRLKDVVDTLSKLKINAKINGNTGNLNVHKAIFPKINWLKFSKEFINYLGLNPDLVTTQIEPYDSLIQIFQHITLINNQLTGLCIDFWMYIGFNYFNQKLIQKEVGSTALPHKINPIYFEGAEGGFGLANSFFEFYCRKLSYSRLQRDLSDSTVRRSFGIAFGYALLSYQSVNEALNRIEPNYKVIRTDLMNHWEVLSEVIQNFLRIKNYPDAYDKTKKFFRGKVSDKDKVIIFINSLGLSKKDKNELTKLTPELYVGFAEEIVDYHLK